MSLPSKKDIEILEFFREKSMITVICQYCSAEEDVVSNDKVKLEINFREKTSYYKCPHCKKTNKIELAKNIVPLARPTTVR